MGHDTKYKNVKFLVVDDDVVDIRTIKRGIRKHKISNPVIEATNGLEALRILRGDKHKSALESPFIILLDLNMPQMNGIEFLRELRRDRLLKHHIVFILTTSSDERDLLKAYEKNVAGYILKSEAGENFMQLIEMLEKFIITIQFPPKA